MVKVREHDVLKALEVKHQGKDAFFTHVKNGRTQAAQTGELAIIDAVAIAKSWSRPVIRGYEVKVERSDFLRDTKWHKYFDMCHEFSFVCPPGIIRSEEIPDNAGLIYFNPEKNSLHTKKKAVYRDIQLPVDMLWYIIICQLDSEHYPFFSKQREYFEMWVEDKTNRQLLGGHRVGEKIRKIAEQIPSLERKIERLNKEKEYLEDTISDLNQVLKPWNIEVSNFRWDWKNKLQEALAAGGVPDLKHAVELVNTLQKELSKAIEASKTAEVTK